MEVFTPYIVV
jgi:hypothetical protein